MADETSTGNTDDSTNTDDGAMEVNVKITTLDEGAAAVRQVLIEGGGSIVIDMKYADGVVNFNIDMGYQPEPTESLSAILGLLAAALNGGDEA